MECLWPVESSNSDYRPAEVPFYEQYGEQQVAAGYYQQVLRYHQHIAPIAEALKHYVQRSI